MSDIYSKTFTGNITADATYEELDKEKSPVNFSVAVNFANGKTIYQNCVYWIATRKNPELLKYLTKGTKITVISNYSEIKTWENADSEKKSREVTYVNQLVLGDVKEKQAESPSTNFEESHNGGE